MQRTELAQYYFKHIDECQDIEVAPSHKLVDHHPTFQPEQRFNSPCVVRVLNKDVIQATLDLLDTGRSVVTLNLASPTRPGGGVKVGSIAQEEEIFRRTAYHKTLLIDFYPLGDNEIVYSPSVPIVRNADYTWVDDRQSVPHAAFIACAGLKWPKVFRGQYFADRTQQECVRRKIRHVLSTAYTHRHTHLVLGALGCGCFRGPPRGIAELFREELETYKFCFQKVVFAILSDEHDPRSLFHVFEEVLCPDVNDDDPYQAASE